MTDDVFIISSYADTEKKVQILESCIDKIKKFGTDIILVSHYPLTSEIYKKAKYYVYDEDNSFVPKGYYARTTGLCTWFSAGDMVFYFYDDFHGLPIVRNIKMALSIAKTAGYRFFYYTESDNIFSEDDFENLVYMKYKTLFSGKKVCFFKNENPSNRHLAYVTAIFAGDTEYFFRSFTFPSTIDQWEKTTYCNNLEVDFYRFFSEGIGPCIQPDINEILLSPSEYFPKSNINVLIRYVLQASVLYNERDPSKPYIACNNWTPNDVNVRVYVNGNILNYMLLKQGTYWIYELDIQDSKNVVIEDADASKVIFAAMVDMKNVDTLLENGRVR